MKSKLTISLVAVLFITGCTSGNNVSIEKPNENKFSSLAELKQAFIDAGGQCWDWVETKVPAEVTKAAAQGDCDSKTVLTIYKDEVNVYDYAIGFRSFNIDLKFKVNRKKHKTSKL